MSKFSVKKPFTVFVAVVAILVLGMVSFFNMTPDLLPNIDLPYVMVITSYPGATPEKVETSVTKPLEQSMATLEHISSVSSTSSANMSSIVLEFTEDVNMDTVTVDILQKISQIEPYWDEMVGTPFLLKLNPSMLPVMVAAVDMEGMDTAQLSAFVEDELLNKLEGTSGVASISAQGMVEKKIEVVLSAERIAALNKDVQQAIDDSFAQAEQELADAEKELKDKQAQLSGAMDELQKQIDDLAEKAGQAGSELDRKQLELLEGKMLIYQQIEALMEQLATLQAAEQLLASVEQTQAAVDALGGQIAQWEQLRDTLAGLDATMAGYAAQLQAVQDKEITEEYTEEDKQAELDAILNSEGYINTAAEIATAEAQLAAAGLTRETLQGAIDDAAQQLALAQGSLDALDIALAAMGLSRDDVSGSLAEVRGAITQLQGAITQLETTLQQLESGEIMLSDAMAQLETQKMAGTIKLSATTSQLTSGQAQLNQAMGQVEAAKEQLKAAKEEAHKNSQLGNILTMEMVSNILRAQNFAMPVGYVTQDGTDYMVSVGEEITSPEELEGLLLLDLGLEDIAPVYLRDVAEVRVSDNLEEIYAKIDGRDGVLLSFTKQSNFATAEASDNLRAQFEKLEEQYPGLHFVSMMDQGDYIHLVVDSILENLLMGALFAIIILFLFLKDLKPTFITLCSIPISVVFAICLMYFSGVTINMISLSGLAVAVGMLVDNSVVVIENIYRLRSRGVPAARAAVLGAQQVAGAIAASTLTTICVFLPIVFVQGLTRQLFADMALTLGYSLMASLVVALTLVPAMSAGMLRNAKEKPNKLLDRALVSYEKSLKWTLKRKPLLLGGVVVLLVLSVVLAFSRGFAFMPEMDAQQITVSIQMPEESELAETKEVADAVMQKVLEIPEVKSAGAMLSGGGMGGMLGLSGLGGGGDTTAVTMYVMLEENAGRSSSQVGEEINALFADAAYEVRASGSSDVSSMMSAMGGSGVSINLYSEDLDALMQVSREVAEVLRGVEGTAEVDDGIGDTNPEIRFVVDKEKAMQEGLTVAQVYAELSKALATESKATSVRYEGENYDVVVVSGLQEELTPSYVRGYSFVVTARDGTEKRIWMHDIAQVMETETAQSIYRENQRTMMTVSAGIAKGYNVSLVNGEAQQALKDYQLPPGVSLDFAGENETIMDAFKDLGQMLLLGVLLVYLIMVAQFQSLKSPFIVMFTIPLAFTGGLLALVFAGMEVSVVALIGFIMLVGIIVNNGIVLVDYINQLRAEGVERKEAIVQAGITRMRPILMTSITTILGLFTMALGMGSGAEMMQPVAVVCIGGLVYATLLTLYVVPAIYDLVNKKELRVVRDEELEGVED